MTQPSIELRAKPSLALTPRLQQSVRLLQLSSIEFAQELRNALSTNPFLEYDDEADEVAAPAVATSAEAPGASADAIGVADAAPEYPVDAYVQRSPAPRVDSDGFDQVDRMQAEPTLREHLHEILRLYPLDGRDRLSAQVIIESLDDDGYLRQSLHDLSQLVEITPQLTEEDLRVALKLVQKLDAPGIGARSLSECLTLQLEALPADTPERALALELVTHHLARLARREHAELQKRLDCSAEALREACLLVRRLDPKPGHGYGGPTQSYVVPDVIVRQQRRRWIVSINPAVMPRARVHRVYADWFAQTAASTRSPLAQQLQEARWLIRNAQQRFTTIQRVAECIVAHQKAFFEYGEIALRPLVLRDVAQELGLHESTVSRATGNKYMATPRGIFEFRHFFPRELCTDSGGTCSSAAVRALLKEMIAAESGDAPLSDVALTKLLAEQGVIVARRTVAKYRRLMKVPPAELRRH